MAVALPETATAILFLPTSPSMHSASRQTRPSFGRRFGEGDAEVSEMPRIGRDDPQIVERGRRSGIASDPACISLGSRSSTSAALNQSALNHNSWDSTTFETDTEDRRKQQIQAEDCPCDEPGDHWLIKFDRREFGIGSGAFELVAEVARHGVVVDRVQEVRHGVKVLLPEGGELVQERR